MQCPFCKHEVNNGAQECPYCHYQFDTNAEVLSSDERDSFAGLTIEEDGSTSGGNTSYEEKGSYPESEQQQQANYGGFQMRTFGGTGCLIWAMVIIFIMVFIALAVVKMFIAMPILGLFLVGYWLNSMFNWF